MAVLNLQLQAPALWEVAVALPLAHTLTYRLPPRLAAAAPRWAAWSGCRWAAAR